MKTDHKSTTLSLDDFARIDMRIGTIIEAEVFAAARKPAYIIHIDFGTELGIKKSSAQITKHYETADLIGKQVVAVVNFAPKQIANIMSECLVLGAVDDQGGVRLLSTDQTVPNGSSIA